MTEEIVCNETFMDSCEKPIGRAIARGDEGRDPPSSTWFSFLAPRYFPILVNLCT
jgi:hypothetical protein